MKILDKRDRAKLFRLRLAEAMAQGARLPLAVARVLARRGVAVDEAAAFLAPSLRDLLPDPLRLRDMAPAAERLIAALEAGAIGGAGLDVFAHEPEADPRLKSLPNVVLLPHMGSATFEGRLASGDKVIANIRFWADGHRPPDQVIEGWA
jgi:hypothetical protein